MADPLKFSIEVLGCDRFPAAYQQSAKWREEFHYITDWHSGPKFRVINTPRGCYKTTVKMCAETLAIASDRNIRILDASETYGLSGKCLRWVRAHLEGNKKLHEAFGIFKPEKGTFGKTPDGSYQDLLNKWGDTEFFVSGRTKAIKEPTLAAAGLDVTRTGDHFDLIFIDDPQSHQNTRTRQSLQSHIEWLQMLIPLLDEESPYGPGGCICVIQTRYDDGDITGWLTGETGDYDISEEFDSLILKAMSGDPVWDEQKRVFVGGTPDFEPMWTMDKLNSRRRLMGPVKFSNQLMNETLDAESQIFFSRWFRLIPHHQVPHRKLMRVHVFTDYAFGQAEHNDRSVIWVVGLDYNRIAYVLDLDAGRWGWSDTNNRAFGYAMKWDADSIGIEYVTSNEGGLEILTKLCRENRTHCKVVSIPGRSAESKRQRIIAMQARFEDSRIYFVEPTDGMFGIDPQFLRIERGKKIGEIIDEFTRFPRHPHDDLPDALSDLDKFDKKNKRYLFPGASGRITGFAGPDRPMQVDQKVTGVGIMTRVRNNSRRTGSGEQGGFWRSAASGRW